MPLCLLFKALYTGQCNRVNDGKRLKLGSGKVLILLLDAFKNCGVQDSMIICADVLIPTAVRLYAVPEMLTFPSDGYDLCIFTEVYTEYFIAFIGRNHKIHCDVRLFINNP